MTESALIERGRAGDHRALRRLYDAHVERVFRVAFRMTGEEELARDLTQETFIRAFGRLDRFRGDSAFSTWLHRVCLNVVLSGLRRVKARRERETSLEEVPERGAIPGGLEPDERDRLRAAVDGLPEIYRTVLLLHDVEGFTHREIAEILVVAEGTSKARLSRARARLREELTGWVEPPGREGDEGRAADAPPRRPDPGGPRGDGRPLDVLDPGDAERAPRDALEGR